MILQLPGDHTQARQTDPPPCIEVNLNSLPCQTFTERLCGWKVDLQLGRQIRGSWYLGNVICILIRSLAYCPVPASTLDLDFSPGIKA